MTAKNAKETMKDVSQKAVKATKDAGEKAASKAKDAGQVVGKAAKTAADKAKEGIMEMYIRDRPCGDRDTYNNERGQIQLRKLIKHSKSPSFVWI